MSLFLVSLGRATADMLRPRVMLLSLLPLALMLGLGWALARWVRGPAQALLTDGLGAWLAGGPVGRWVYGGLSALGLDWGQAGDWEWRLAGWLAAAWVALVLGVLVLAVGLLLISLMSMPAVLSLVSARHFPQLQRRGSRAWLRPVLWGLGHTLVALVVLVLSLPLWLLPPLMVLLPLAIWAWLTERVMAHDALQWHASVTERRQLMRAHRLPLLGMGLASAVLSAAPTLVWASLLWFALAFVVLVPLAVWLYTVVFLWTALWFAHYALLALQRQRSLEPQALP